MQSVPDAGVDDGDELAHEGSENKDGFLAVGDESPLDGFQGQPFGRRAAGAASPSMTSGKGVPIGAGAQAETRLHFRAQPQLVDE